MPAAPGERAAVDHRAARLSPAFEVTVVGPEDRPSLLARRRGDGR